MLGKNQQAKLDVKERPDFGVYVKDLSTVMVHSPNEMEKLMGLGNKNREVFFFDFQLIYIQFISIIIMF